MNRREFVATSAAGSALLLMPSLLTGCRQGKLSPGYFGEYGIDDALLQRILSAALATGGDYADLFLQHNSKNFVGLQDGEVDRAYCTVELGCGVRVLQGDQTGFAFTEDLSEGALKAAADTAAAVARSGAASPASLRVAEPPTYYAAEVPWAEVGIDQKMPVLERADITARAADSRIVKVSAWIGDETSHVLVASSDGRLVEDVQPMTTMSVVCTAEDQGRREIDWFNFGRRAGFEVCTNKLADELAGEAAQRAVRLFEAAPPPAGEYPVVLAPGISGILLHEAMGHGFEADFNRKGTSIYADRIGTKVAPDFVTIVDDATMQGHRGSINTDDEAVDGQQTVLVEDGVLRSYLHDRISADHYGVQPTGNGRRQSYQYPPVPRMRTTYMLPGPHDPEEIISSVKMGLYAETFTNGQVDIGAGDFSFYLKDGFLIEDGKLTRPAKDANLIGLGPKVLELTDMVGTDMQVFSSTFVCGKDGQRVPVSFGLPTVKCGGISVGGVA
jgi:TldD protein